MISIKFTPRQLQVLQELVEVAKQDAVADMSPYVKGEVAEAKQDQINRLADVFSMGVQIKNAIDENVLTDVE